MMTSRALAVADRCRCASRARRLSGATATYPDVASRGRPPGNRRYPGRVFEVSDGQGRRRRGRARRCAASGVRRPVTGGRDQPARRRRTGTSPRPPAAAVALFDRSPPPRCGTRRPRARPVAHRDRPRIRPRWTSATGSPRLRRGRPGRGARGSCRRGQPQRRHPHLRPDASVAGRKGDHLPGLHRPDLRRRVHRAGLDPGRQRLRPPPATGRTAIPMQVGDCRPPFSAGVQRMRGPLLRRRCPSLHPGHRAHLLLHGVLDRGVRARLMHHRRQRGGPVWQTGSIGSAPTWNNQPGLGHPGSQHVHCRPRLSRLPRRLRRVRHHRR